ncbi:60S ribosomal protein L5 [Mucor velutinosus]|uniref:60S ribosomal protein L5 n=1 Tax=Mucor velutinosus TaxID=708070 RepID=A0AAN7DE31_9FUNG|nr:60S ribosomal protein L5 [Mucor velutinosus]
MTSIIGYTRVPFNPSCSIAPVQRLYQARPPLTRTDHNDHIVCNDENKSTSKSSRPTTTFHRMFSRESSGSNGIIELIGDTTKIPPLESSKIAIVTKPAKDNSKSSTQKSRKITTAITTSTQSNLKNYNTHLSIDLNNQRDYQQLPTLTIDDDDANDSASSKNYDNLQRLMDSIAKLAYDKSIKFLNIIELLKQLQTYQDQYRFMSCIDKQKQVILVYFPNTLSTNAHQTQQWLKAHAGIDVERYHDWHLVQDVSSPPPEQQQEKDFFDGPKYFDDIHMFINQVDALIESNGLFSQAAKKGENH